MTDMSIRAQRLHRQQCPDCGVDLETGFGLAGGGYGPYLYCPSETCGKYFEKFQEMPDDAQPR